jgi:hypothetical protein
MAFVTAGEATATVLLAGMVEGLPTITCMVYDMIG